MSRKAAPTKEKIVERRMRSFTWCGHQAQSESEWPACRFQHVEERKYDDGFVVVYTFANVPSEDASQFEHHMERRLRHWVSGQGYVRHRIEVQVS